MHHTDGASGAGLSTPTTNDEVRATVQVVSDLRDRESRTRPEYEAVGDDPATAGCITRENASSRVIDTRQPDHKRFATLQARAAIAGVALSRIEDDRGHEVFVASKWALTKQLATLAEVEDLLARIGGPSAD